MMDVKFECIAKKIEKWGLFEKLGKFKSQIREPKKTRKIKDEIGIASKEGKKE